MIYTSTLAAVVSALAAEAIDNTSKQAWQKLYRPGYADGGSLESLMRSSGEKGITRMDADCWVYARLHSQLIPRHWNVLMARYSTHRQKKRDAIEALIPLIATPAPHRFLGMAVYTWAIPKLRGVPGRRSTDMIVLPAEFYDINTWDGQGLNRTTYWRWKKAIEKVLDEMVAEALVASSKILQEEGVLMADAA